MTAILIVVDVAVLVTLAVLYVAWPDHASGQAHDYRPDGTRVQSGSRQPREDQQ